MGWALVVAGGVCGWAQEATPSMAATSGVAPGQVPALVRYAGELPEEAGKRVAVRFAVYSTATGTSALWSESQSVSVGTDGKYSVVLGAGSSIGIPQSLFAAGETRWLGVRLGDGPELQRALLVSVPYAMKAGDAESLGGRAVADFVTQEQLAGLTALQGGGLSSGPGRVLPQTTTPTSPTGSGTANYLPIWTSSTALGTSIISQTGTGANTKVGIGTTSPNATLTVAGGTTVLGTLNMTATALATSSAGVNSPLIEMTANSYNSSSAASVAQKFGWEIVATGNNTSAPGASMSLFYGTGTPTATGFSISPTGIVTFAAGQTFPAREPGLGPLAW